MNFKFRNGTYASGMSHLMNMVMAATSLPVSTDLRKIKVYPRKAVLQS